MPEPNDQKFPREDGRGEPRHDASWLYMRYKDNPADPDLGTRPLAPGTVCWLSPDILVSPVDSLGNVQSGTQVTVKARIFNGGALTAYNVYVEFWWFDPSTAFSAALLNQRIGTKIVNIPGNNYLEVECPVKWTPGYVNQGHECLVVQCSSPSGGADDLKFPLMTALDRHVAQQNLSVLPQQGGAAFRLTLSNPFSTAGCFSLRLRSVFISTEGNAFSPRTIRRSAVELANRLRQTTQEEEEITREQNVRVMELTHREFRVKVVDVKRPVHATPESRQLPGTAPKKQAVELYLQKRAFLQPDFNDERLGHTVAEMHLAPHERQVLTIEVPALKLKSGSFLVHHFTQVVNGMDIGGYSFLLAPEEFTAEAELDHAMDTSEGAEDC